MDLPSRQAGILDEKNRVNKQRAPEYSRAESLLIHQNLPQSSQATVMSKGPAFSGIDEISIKFCEVFDDEEISRRASSGS